jgi:hypothetical protein
MTKKQIFFFLIFTSFFSLKAQEVKKGIFNIKKIGILYNNAQDNNFLFDDKDYSYGVNVYKLQAYYVLGNWHNLNFELIIQPQIQVAKHRLLNSYFVLPTEDDFENKIKQFTAPKTMYLYGFELGFVVKKKVLKKLDVQATVGLGIANIDTRTERLAKGFTFIENGSLGFSYKTTEKSFLYLGCNIGHVSNLNFKSPNSGYNILGFEIGFSYLLK